MPEKALTLEQLRRRRSVKKETEAKIASMMLDLSKNKKAEAATPKIEEKVVATATKKEEKAAVIAPPPVKEQKPDPVAETKKEANKKESKKESKKVQEQKEATVSPAADSIPQKSDII